MYYFAGYAIGKSKGIECQVLTVTVRVASLTSMLQIAKALPDVRWTQGIGGGKPSIDIPSAV